MSGHFFLDWAALSVSLFNTILLLWLGSTVLLNADRRTWGIWIASGGLLLGGAFFVSHTAILGLEFSAIGRGLRFWWYLGLLPAVALPFGWYLVMLWYAGFWDNTQAPLHRRQRRWLLPILALVAAGLAAVIAYANPLAQDFSLLPVRFAIQGLGGTPLLMAGYGVYLLLCFGLSLDALLRPGPTARTMGDLARQRARVWLVVASILWLLVSLLIIAVLLWTLLNVRHQGVYIINEQALLTLTRFDLLIASLIAVAVVVLGQAVVAYEIFTGKTLPRRGLRRQWGLAIILAVGYGLLVGWTLTIHLRPVYSVLLTTMLMTFFFALLSWRSYAERERYIDHLRPFVASQGLYEHLLYPAAATPPDVTAPMPFYALCRDVLGARLAYLVALGPLAPLAGPSLAYPHRAAPVTLPPLGPLTARFHSPQTMNIPLDPAAYQGATWAIPLWSERGLIGVLLLGEKRDGGLYTQEEIEIARASGERLIDTQASAEMARRLLALQRQHLSDSQVIDRRTRRVLHDDVLPLVHTALLSLSGRGSGGNSEYQEAITLLADAHRQISNLLRDFPHTVTPEVVRLGVIGALRQAVAEDLGRAFDELSWEVDTAIEAQARAIPSLTAEVLFYAAREAIRNAARHGRGSDQDQALHLRVSATLEPNGLALLIEDNGVGLSAPAGDGGSGQGLALHSTMMAVVGGTLATESVPGEYTRVTLTLPLAAHKELGRVKSETRPS
ncbi:MAG: hypothetical protein L0332_15810 [Chloroflexi bacterium]|nr:hypothetical protein [Chloroflexota bacterium]MCI0578680.1 hypothetical protein [Chloroflexota bacterium]MCI0643274.1 hypothetical protein [Chloroflexota bacterium]MCI0728167.1 hypothetical protein [Chloroflexota bacterium]